EGDGGAETGERERSRRDDRLRQLRLPAERRVDQPAERLQRVVSGGCEHERREPEGEDERPDRNGDVEPARLLEPPLDPDHCAVSRTPAIRRPISSTVAVFASTSPTISPSNITATRSASARISSRSSLISSTATPAAAASRR